MPVQVLLPVVIFTEIEYSSPHYWADSMNLPIPFEKRDIYET